MFVINNVAIYFSDILKCRKFKIIDDDGSKTISRPEFRKAISELGLDLDKAALEECFNAFDRDGSGTIDFDEFLAQLRVSSFDLSGVSRISETAMVLPGPKKTRYTILALYPIKNTSLSLLYNLHLLAWGLLRVMIPKSKVQHLLDILIIITELWRRLMSTFLKLKMIILFNFSTVLYSQPPMSKARTNLIRQAFQKLDKTGDGFVTVEDLKGVYNVKQVYLYYNILLHQT